MEVVQRTNVLLNKTWSLDSIVRWFSYLGKILAVVHQRQGNVAMAKKIGTLTNCLGEYRTITRFTGVPDTIEALGAHLQTSPNRPDYFVELCQHISMLFYYPLEHIAWLRDLNVLSGPTDRLWRGSSQAWAVWALLEIGLVWKKYRNPKATPAEKASLRLYLFKCITDFILAWHWSVKKSPFSEMTIGWVGLLGTTASLYPKWASTK